MSHLDVLAALDRHCILLELAQQELAGLVNALLHGDWVGARCDHLSRHTGSVTAASSIFTHASVPVAAEFQNFTQVRSVRVSVAVCWPCWMVNGAAAIAIGTEDMSLRVQLRNDRC